MPENCPVDRSLLVITWYGTHGQRYESDKPRCSTWPTLASHPQPRPPAPFCCSPQPGPKGFGFVAEVTELTACMEGGDRQRPVYTLLCTWLRTQNQAGLIFRGHRSVQMRAAGEGGILLRIFGLDCTSRITVVTVSAYMSLDGFASHWEWSKGLGQGSRATCGSPLPLDAPVPCHRSRGSGGLAWGKGGLAPRLAPNSSTAHWAL